MKSFNHKGLFIIQYKSLLFTIKQQFIDNELIINLVKIDPKTLLEDIFQLLEKIKHNEIERKLIENQYKWEKYL